MPNELCYEQSSRSHLDPIWSNTQPEHVIDPKQFMGQRCDQGRKGGVLWRAGDWGNALNQFPTNLAVTSPSCR